MSILDKAREGQNLLEKLANMIPGFRGYREKELRRDTDRLEREHLASRLEDVKGVFNDVATAVSRSGNLDAINDVETAKKRLDKVVARIRYADRGYGGFFDAVKVDETVLAKVYEFDVSLVEGVNAVRDAAAQASGAPDAKAGIRAVITEIDRIDASLAEREAILGGLR
jgi:hypothetical protein